MLSIVSGTGLISIIVEMKQVESDECGDGVLS